LNAVTNTTLPSGPGNAPSMNTTLPSALLRATPCASMSSDSTGFAASTISVSAADALGW
jgi:hypothetical protein